ncbi:hypothetical protein EIP91_010714 [Steccherinum ochraceum]|uniref:Uncharacterized protein n=1 Tax=Steccherinum ochraceum TaxID=92696 RepID=A0A4V2MUW0_9APHY|nr:hypothetical protein EIP91_010714 [Steccherinum ochraceum]
MTARATSAPALSQVPDGWEDISSLDRCMPNAYDGSPLDEPLPIPIEELLEESTEIISEDDAEDPSTPHSPHSDPYPVWRPAVPTALGAPWLNAPSPYSELPELQLEKYSSAGLHARLVVCHWNASETEVIDEHVSRNTSPRPSQSHSSRSPKQSAATELNANITTSSSGTIVSHDKTTRWYCRVCFQEPADPTATICGHVFCHEYVFELRS